MPFCSGYRGHQEGLQEGSKVYLLPSVHFSLCVCVWANFPLVSDGPMVRDLYNVAERKVYYSKFSCFPFENLDFSLFVKEKNNIIHYKA